MKNSSPSNANERPSRMGAFFRGSLSGAINGALMIGIFALLSPIFGGTIMATLASAPLMICATSVFGGIMAVKNAIFDSASTPEGRITRDTATIVPVMTSGLASPAAAPDMAPEAAPSKSWVAQTGRNEDSLTRVQQILNNGAMSDKDRASAILASREAAAAEPNRSI